MSALRPDGNKGHDLGTSTVKWGTAHLGDLKSETGTFSSNLTVEGNLTVTGTQTSLQVSTVEAEDPLIKLARGNSGDTLDIGFYGQSNDGSDKYHGLYRDQNDGGKFKLFKDLASEPSTTVGTLASGNKATLVSHLEGDVTGALTGNADTATTLETARTIAIAGDVAGSVSFNGSADVSITSVIQATSVENSMLAGSIADGKLAEDYIKVAEVDDSSIEVNGSGNLQVKAVGITNGMLAGSIANSKLVNDSVSFGGVSLDLGQTDATPAFDLSDATAYRTSALDGDVADSQLAEDYLKISEVDDSSIEFDSVGGHIQVKAVGITNGMLAGSIANAKLSNSTVSFGGVSLALGASDATPAFDLSDATAYRASALDGSISNSQLAGSIVNAKLSNSVISFKVNGGTGEDIALGADVDFVGTSDEIDVAYNTTGSKYTFSLPSTINADTSGNAATATALASARTFEINQGPIRAAAVSFQGTSNVQLTSTIADDQITNDMIVNPSMTFSDGTNSSDVVLGGTLTIQGTTNEVEVAENAGTYTVGLPSTISSSTSGNAATATALASGRNFEINAGPVRAAAVAFDGTGNLQLETSIANDQITNAMLANEKLVIQVDGVDYDRVLGSTLEFDATNLDLTYSASENKVIYGLPASIASDTSGNAGTASAWETARTITFAGGDVTGAFTANGSADVGSIDLTIGAGKVLNTMLDNSGITIGDGSNSESIALGGEFEIKGTSNEIEVAYSTANNEFVVGLPNSVSITSNLDVGGNLTLSGAAIISGNITAAGQLSASGANISFADTLIELGVNNTSSKDHGFYSQRASGSFAGFVFDESSDKFQVFTTDTEPTTTVDTAQGGYSLADLCAKDIESTTMVATSTLQGALRSSGSAPASATAAGTAGDIRFDSGKLYVCVATNTWKAADLATF